MNEKKPPGGLTPEQQSVVTGYLNTTPEQEISEAANRPAPPGSYDMGGALSGQGTFRDTGRESEGFGESLDSLIGAPARVAVDEFRKGNFTVAALERIFNQIGSDPRLAPTGYAIASEITDDPTLGTFLSSAIDFGAQLPGGQFLMPGVRAQIKGVKSGAGNIVDALEAFAARAEAPLHTETKIAQFQGKTGDVRDAVPALMEKAKPESWKEAEWRAQEALDQKARSERIAHREQMIEKGATSRAKEIAQEIEDSRRFTEEFELGDAADDYAYYIWEGKNSVKDLENVGPNLEPIITAAKESGLEDERILDVLKKYTTMEAHGYRIPDDNYLASFNLGEREIQIDDLAEKLKKLTPEEREFLNWEQGVRTDKDDDYIYHDMSDSVYYAIPDIEKIEKSLKRMMKRASKGSQKPASDKAPFKPTLVGPKKYAHGGIVQPQKFANGGVVAQGMRARVPGWDTINVIDPEGNIGSIPLEQWDEAVGLGYKEAPKELIDKAKMEDKFGGIGGGAAAAGLGFLRGATLGASDVLATRSGLVEPETIKALQEIQPGASILGEVGSAFLPTGAASTLGKVGKGVYGATKAAKVADNASLATKVLASAQNVGAQALGSAVEGALYSGVTNSLNEMALGDPTLNGEKILGHFGHGAIFGGAAGGVLKAASIAAPEALRAAKSGLTEVRDLLIGAGRGQDSLASKVLERVDPTWKLSDALRNRAMNLDVDQRSMLVEKTTTGLNRVRNNIESSIKKLNQTIRPEERKLLIDTANPVKSVHARQDLITELNRSVELMKREPHLYAPGPMRELELIRQGIVNKMGKDKSPSQIMDRLIEARQAMDNIVFDKMSASATKSRDVIEGIRGKFRDTLHDPDVFGLAGAAQSSHDDVLSKLYKFVSPKVRRPTEFQKLFMSKTGYGPNMRWEFDASKVERALKQADTVKGRRATELLDEYYDMLKELPDHLENTFANVPNNLWDAKKFSKMKDSLEKAHFEVTESQMKYGEAMQNLKGRNLELLDLLPAGAAAIHPVVGAGLAAYNMISRPIEHINKLAEVERIIGRIDSAVSSGTRAVFDSTLKTTGKLKGVISKEADPYDDENFDDYLRKINELNNNPEMLINRLEDGTRQLYQVAPNMTESAQQSMMKGIQFLAAKAPKDMTTNPFDPPYQPSQMEKAQFQRYVDLVEDPMLALEQVRNRTVTPETVEVLSAVYPRLYDYMKMSLLDEASSILAKGGTIPYQTKQSMSMFLGQPLDQAMLPLNVAANQDVFVMDKSSSQNVLKPKKVSLPNIKSMTLAKRTGLERRAKDD
jgi:hypothetical protein